MAGIRATFLYNITEYYSYTHQLDVAVVNTVLNIIPQVKAEFRPLGSCSVFCSSLLPHIILLS